MDMTPKSPEPEPETPNRIQPAKPISFTNGFLKHHHHPILTTFKECLKNHAAATGGHALDGCGEFMPSPHSTPSDPTSLKCAACGCHRNFHRRDPDDSSAVPPPPLTEYQPHHRHHPPPPPAPPLSPNSSSPLPISSSYMLLSLSGANKTGGNSVPFTDPNANSVPFADPNANSVPFSDLNFSANTPGSRKRFRTKFSRDQKEKMHEFAERIGWKIQKRDEEDVHRFCREVGVERGVLKVWMHNNKNAVNNSRRDLSFSGGISTVKTIDDDGIPVPGERTANGSSSTS